jgi:hypothetical protein
MPFHILLNKDLVVMQCGDIIKQRAKVPIIPGVTLFRDIAVIVQPIITLSAEQILHFINSVFYIAIKSKLGLQAQVTIQGIGEN